MREGIGDGGVLPNSEFGQSLEKDGDLNIPPDQSMPGLFWQCFYLWL